ncbi:DUF6912 family protein [Nocardioides sp.]|uniref:DUF6912 family protein n=1 Tax=Nocardioides sp. TaxID=35761 RepID=UPI0037841FAF
MRIYLPTTLGRLAEDHAAGAVPVGGDVVVAEDESEEAEYAALMTAADASTVLLGGAGRRVVVVADVRTAPGGGDRVPFADVVAVHADLEDRPEGADPDEDLAWFATQEVPDLL